ncbi:cupin domain-containing protein [Bordetella petrii]|uniref:cupin domain-containing protein n=1 Tax=Bordetella petrii TaxID=94624 RepID=UPI001E2B2E0D|nr:cupin domain-containing protein [Bordetella petrii]MCD0502356.1 cupin domain-containing protein [Bordetella petrii]
MPHIVKTGLSLMLAGSLLGPAAMAAQPGGHAAHTAQAGKPADAIVTPLMTKGLPDIPGKEAVMITVDYPPGAADPVHRHDAHSFVYVLEGSIVMQVQGGKEVTLTPGQTFYEGPHDIHTVGRNASQTEPARFVVVLIKEKGAPILSPLQ